MYPPKSLSDLPLPDSTIAKLKEITKFDGGLYIFYEHPGTGKTTAAKIIARQAVEELGPKNVAILNGSNERRIEDVRQKIEPFVRGKGDKLLILEEADGLTQDAQKALKEIITETTNRVTYIFTTNHIASLIDPIVTRGIKIYFMPDKKKLLKLLSEFCKKNKINVTNKQLLEVIEACYPNFREMMNLLRGSDQFSIFELKNDLIKLYNNHISVKEFKQKYAGVTIDTLISAVKMLDEEKVPDLPWIAIFAWKVAANRNPLSTTALLYFINLIKNNPKARKLLTDIL